MNTLSLEFFDEQYKTIEDPMRIIENMAETVMKEYNLKEGELKWHLKDVTCHAQFGHDTDGNTITTTVNYQEDGEPVSITRHTFYGNGDPMDRQSEYEIHAENTEFGMSDNLFVESSYCQNLSRVLQR